MKWILAISLALNIALGVLVMKREKAPVYERVVIETHVPQEPQEADEVKTSFASPKRSLENEELSEKEAAPEPFSVPAGEEEMAETHEKMEASRTEFLTHELGLASETMFEYQRLRNEYFEKTSKIWEKNPYGELSFDDRRRMLDMEEKLHASLSKLLGQKNWERYQKYREEYNKQGFEKQVEENRPFLFMGL